MKFAIQELDSDVSSYLSAAAQMIGQEFVLDSERVLAQYARSCSARTRRALAVVKPESTSEVQQLVRLAGQHGIQLYPVSRGCNWGLGDACPTTSNQVILDLGRMNRIQTADAELGAFSVEPGVTQQQMFEYLESNNLPFWYDASGAGPDASLLGNLMERGYGHTPLGERFQNSCNYEIVLADGSLIRTGFGDDPSCRVKDLFKPGVGPSLDGLFTQSNFGIVTRATFWMMRIPEHFEAYAIQMQSDRQLEEAIDALQPLRASGIISSALHIGNDFRVFSARTQYPYHKLDGQTAIPEAMRTAMRQQYGVAAWNALGAYYGTKRGVRAFRADFRDALKGIAKPIFLTERLLGTAARITSALNWIPMLHQLGSKVQSALPVIALLKGQPVRDHLAGAGWRSRTPWHEQPTDPLERRDGVIWYTPIVPCKGQEVQQLNQIIHAAFDEFAFEPLLTYVMISARAMVCPTTICFDATCAKQTARAQACLDRLREQCQRAGYTTYRQASYQHQPATSRLLVNLKNFLDTQGILAPGRYGL